MELDTALGAGVWKLNVVQFSYRVRVWRQKQERDSYLNMLMHKGLLKNADEDGQ
jgi:hypothetical protein